MHRTEKKKWLAKEYKDELMIKLKQGDYYLKSYRVTTIVIPELIPANKFSLQVLSSENIAPA